MKIEIIEVSADWDRSDYGACDPCHIKIDDLGNFQCTECLGLFGRQDNKLVIKYLKIQYGEFWKEEYEKLKITKSLVSRNKFKQLTKYSYTYKDKNGIIKTNRYFYEKR